MSNDAKLGLVLGVAIVLVIGLLFFRTDALATGAPKTANPTTALPAATASAEAPQLTAANP